MPGQAGRFVSGQVNGGGGAGLVGPMPVRTVHRPESALPDDLVDRVVRVLLPGLAPKPQVTAGHRRAPDVRPRMRLP